MLPPGAAGTPKVIGFAAIPELEVFEVGLEVLLDPKLKGLLLAAVVVDPPILTSSTGPPFILVAPMVGGVEDSSTTGFPPKEKGFEGFGGGALLPEPPKLKGLDDGAFVGDTFLLPSFSSSLPPSAFGAKLSSSVISTGGPSRRNAPNPPVVVSAVDG